ncbi:MAG TPA: hypothetical protein VEF03_05750, partial [Candidatus Binataceae bacterium]|nr:hypothetical protein [Candidatus Binataceae bacterium]
MNAELLRNLSFAHPGALWLLVAPCVVFFWAAVRLRSFARLGAPLMRAVGLTLFILALAAPEKVMRTEGSVRPAMI